MGGKCTTPIRCRHSRPARLRNPVLTGALYYGDALLTATYTYQGPNVGEADGYPLLSTCDDPMYGGAMAQISYTYATAANPDGTPAVYGQILSENHYTPATGATGPAVSTLSINEDTRTETRGDGPSRTFTYVSNGFLGGWTDFNAQVISQGHDPNGFVSSMTDPRGQSQSGYTTDMAHDARTGNVTSVTYPLTPSDTSNTRPTIVRAYNSGNNPYYVTSVRDERLNATTYTRDPTTQRVTDINYPDAAHEGFLYNGFGQVTRRQRKSEKYEHFEYDARGLLLRVWNPVANSAVPTSGAKTTIAYYPVGHAWQDRVQSVIDPRGKVTTYEYDRLANGSAYGGRGLVTKIIYPGEKYRTFSYDRLGNLTRQENELRQPVEYVYDDYSRVLQMKTARPSASNPAVQDGWITTATYNYTPAAAGLSSYARTANAPTKMTGATGLTRSIVYDANLRVERSTQVDLINSANSATTESHYDPAGNVDWVKDPNGNQTTFEYDQRNRRKKAISPQVDVAGITGKVALVTEWLYDPAGNVRLVIRPDDTTASPRRQSFTYDELNRVLSAQDAMNRVTTNTYFPNGQLKSVKDAKNQLTQFDYDERDLRTKLTYPNDTELTGWQYDEAGNMTRRPTIGGPKQLFTYDDRNRPTAMRWDNAIDFSDFGYDEVGRLTSANNPNAAITRQYDVAGRLILDRQAFPAVQNTQSAPPPAQLLPQSVVSRRSHGGAGSFDIPLPLTGTPGVECRNGSDLSIVLTFASAVSVGNVTVSSGTALVANPHPASGSTITVNLTGVSNAQRLSITLTGLSNDTVSGDLVVPVQVLTGDVTGNGQVNASDKGQVQANAGAPLSAANFRCDVNCSGTISASDVGLVNAASGAAMPSALPPNQTADVSYGYDDDGRVNRLSVTGTDYDYTFGYDALGRFATISATNGGIAYQYFYDNAANVLERRNNVNGTTQLSVPDEMNRLKERVLKAKREVNGQLEAYEFSHERYAFDAMSRLASTVRDEDGGKRDAFAYNGAGELERADYGQQWNGTVWVNPARWVTYNLDPAGNREGSNGMVENNVSTTFSPNALNQYEQTSNGSQHEIAG